MLDDKVTKDSKAFTRYADKAWEKEIEPILQFPRDKPYGFFNAADIYRVPKTNDHWEILRRSKSFIADDFFPPV